MSKIVRLGGKAPSLLETLLRIISATTTDPLYHISEIVQNEMDADALGIDITFFRKPGKSRRIKKIVVDGNGFGFLESFEHYVNNISSSIKKYSGEYLDRKARGLSRGEFCIGIQGFRAVCEELHLVNKTKEGITPKVVEDKQIDDPDFHKMFRNRKLILRSNTLDAEIKEEDEFTDHRDGYGVTCTLVNPKLDIKSSDLVKYLSQNKRTELFANKNLKLTVNDGSFTEIVKPIKYRGKRRKFNQAHPKEKESHKYRGFGELEAMLYFHQAKPGSKIRLDIKNEPIYFDITDLPEFDGPPWDSDFVEGVIEYPHLEKSPLRSGVARDNYFWPAFVEMMSELAKAIAEIVKEYEEESRTKRDKQLMKKLERVMAEVKRELDFVSWFDRRVKKPDLGPLNRIKLFPKVANVPAFSTRRVHVRAYDVEGNVLKEKDDISFGWKVGNDLGPIIPKRDGEAIFKAGSRVGASVLEATVKDLKTDKDLSAEMEIAVIHPATTSGKLARVKIEPMFSKLPLGSEKEYKAVAEDEDRNPITKGVTFQWAVPFDETSGAKLNNDYGESVILTPGRNQGTIKLEVTAYKGGLSATDFAMVTVVEKKPGKPPKPKGLNLPILDPYSDPYEFPLTHSHLSKDGSRLKVNEGHPNYKNAVAKGKKQRQRYIANLYAKELAAKECEATGSADFGEKMLDVLSKIDRFW